ncbi:MAG TPA: GNAT family N-acetyltransferase, partial [Rhizomicrobium sp.]|nr:GNAT family N-acetyltransferase [Rhizomicrobium sp.]
VWGPEFLGRLLAQPGAFSLVALERGEPAGFVVARAVVGEAEILSLGVRHESRRQGLGSGLIRMATARAAAMGAAQICLEVAVENDAARALYGALGFREVGARPAYYHGTGGVRGDGLILKRALINSGENPAIMSWRAE